MSVLGSHHYESLQESLFDEELKLFYDLSVCSITKKPLFIMINIREKKLIKKKGTNNNLHRVCIETAKLLKK